MSITPGLILGHAENLAPQNYQKHMSIQEEAHERSLTHSWSINSHSGPTHHIVPLLFLQMMGRQALLSFECRFVHLVISGFGKGNNLWDKSQDNQLKMIHGFPNPICTGMCGLNTFGPNQASSPHHTLGTVDTTLVSSSPHHWFIKHLLSLTAAKQ